MIIWQELLLKKMQNTTIAFLFLFLKASKSDFTIKLNV